MLFAKPGEYEACGIFSIDHFLLLTISTIGIIIALRNSRKMNREQIKSTIMCITIMLWIFEAIKIIFNIAIGNIKNPNTYIPLYFCSLILYAGIFSSFGKGKIKHVGDVFIATGGIIAGTCFLIFPVTSLTAYPIFHFISLQSFILHSSMVYLGILVNIRRYVTIKKQDFKYYFLLIVIISIIAYAFNSIFDSNLMFISKNFPGTPIEMIYNLSGKLYPAIITLIQAIIPFYIIYFVIKILKQKK